MAKDLLSSLDQIEKEADQKIKKAQNLKDLSQIKINFLGRKKGKLTLIFKQIPKLSPSDKRKIGPQINSVKNKITLSINQRFQALTKTQKDIFFDPTAPGKQQTLGHLHPITQVRIKAEQIFQKMGFEVVEPREIDNDYYVFESLNIPQGHPARDMWDTFWTENDHIPITHTSSMQNRMIKEKKPPIRVIVPGRCFRHEATDARHEHTFYQIEGIYVDKNITLAHLIGTLLTFLEEYFEKKLKYKIQPSYFPFVEPGLEFLISCVICDGKGCSTCGKAGWLELVPCGPIHPRVLEMGGLDPEVYSGFAWGLGLDRLVMLKYAIEDIRLFHSGDLRFLRQF